MLSTIKRKQVAKYCVAGTLQTKAAYKQVPELQMPQAQRVAIRNANYLKWGDEVERIKRRKRCGTCKYRGCNENGCDYIYITGHRRGSSVEECSRYEKGKRIKAKMVKLKL